MESSFTTPASAIATHGVIAGEPAHIESASKDNGGRLARAMQAVNDFDDQDVKTKAEDSRDQIAAHLKQGGTNQIHPNLSCSGPDGTESENHAKYSSRILKIQDKQTAMKDMIAKIRENCEVLMGIEQQAESFASYLESAEADFGYLESKETTLANLYKAAIDLATRYKDAKSTIAGQIETISLLDDQNSANLVSLDNSRLQVARLESVNETQSREIFELKDITTKLEESSRLLTEKNEFSKKVEERIAGELITVNERLENALSVIDHKDTILAENSGSIENLNSQIVHQLAELKAQQSNYSELQDKYFNNKEILQNITVELDSLRGEVDDRVLRVRNRCAEIESYVEITTPQPVYPEDDEADNTST